MNQSVKTTNLSWKFDRRVFVTVCPDGNVILNGKVMTLEKATEILLKTKGVPISAFWEL